MEGYQRLTLVSFRMNMTGMLFLYQHITYQCKIPNKKTEQIKFCFVKQYIC